MDLVGFKECRFSKSRTCVTQADVPSSYVLGGSGATGLIERVIRTGEGDGN